VTARTAGERIRTLALPLSEVERKLDWPLTIEEMESLAGNRR
jgi:hypothetical protein